MSGVELILTALMTGAAAGTTAGATSAAQSAVVDTYTGLRDLLRRVLTRQGGSGEVLDAVQAEPGTWQTRLGAALTDTHADQDQQVLAAAWAVLAAADPDGTAAGKYTVTVSDSTGVQVGDHTVYVGTNYGNTAATTTGPVSVTYGQVPNPPDPAGGVTRSSTPGSTTDHTTSPTTSIRDNYGAEGIFHGPVTVNGRTAVGFPHRSGVVPPVAVGRLERPVDTVLEAAVAAGGGAAVVCQVLAGLGGVGKTQLAAGLARRWWQDGRVDLLVWVTATSRAAVLARYAQTAADVTGVDDPDPQDGALRLLAWLAATGRRWLLVLDDVTDPADLQGLWPPDSAAGATIVTTRRRDTALLAGRALIDVGVFSPTEAAEYLHGRLGDAPHRLDEAADLAADLGGLPLALAQAAAYIVDQDLTCAGYRRRLTRCRLHLLRPQVLPDDQLVPVADTWALSIDLADAATGGVAGVLLRLAGLLDPNGIPAGLFSTAAVTGYCTTCTGQLVDGEDVHDGLRMLHRLGLLTAPPAGDGAGLVRVHALLQRVVREHTPAEDEHDLAIVAADAINEIWPDLEPDAGTAQPLRANTMLLHRHTGPQLWIATDAVHPVLIHAGNSLGENGLFAAARDYFHHLHAAANYHLGPGHPATLTTGASLADWRGRAGDPVGAATALQQVLTYALRVLGPDHPTTLTTRHNLGYWQGLAGDPAAGAAALRQLLEDRLRVLGPEHPETLRTRHNLADWQGEAGDPAGAATALQQLLADQMRVLGPDNSATLHTRFNLAYWTGLAGDPAGALTASRLLLEDRLRVLSPDHRQILSTRNICAYWQGEAGDPVGAVTAFRLLLEDRLRVLGPDHPGTLQTRHNLARKLGDAGDPVAAAADLQQVLENRLRVLGPDHPRTLHTRLHLAYWRGEAGDPARAASDYQKLLEDLLRVLGQDHPRILTTRHHLAYYRGRAGQLADAAIALEQVLTDQLRVLGRDHPDTFRTRHSLARGRGEAGDPAGAATDYQKLLEDQLRVLAPDHPHTLDTRHNLAHWRGQAGDSAGAVTSLQLLLTDQLRVLCSGHPDTLATRHNLAYWQQASARPASEKSPR